MRYEVTLDDRRVRVELGDNGRFTIGDHVVAADVRETERGRQWSIALEGESHEITVVTHEPLRLDIDGHDVRANVIDERALHAGRGVVGLRTGRVELRAPMPGLLKAVHVKEGDRVGVPWLYSACGHCEYCLAAWETVCAWMNLGNGSQPDTPMSVPAACTQIGPGRVGGAVGRAPQHDEGAHQQAEEADQREVVEEADVSLRERLDDHLQRPPLVGAEQLVDEVGAGGAAREVVLAAGAIGSPHLLQLSGVGAPEQLASSRIASIATKLSATRIRFFMNCLQLIFLLRTFWLLGCGDDCANSMFPGSLPRAREGADSENLSPIAIVRGR